MRFLRGRMARPASRGWNLGKTMAQTFTFWSLFLIVIPAGILAMESRLGLDAFRFGGPWSHWLGGVLFASGGTLGITSGVIMALRGKGTPLPADCARELVVSGPYRYLRNPMAVAGLTQGFAVGIFCGSPSVMAYAMLGGPVWHLLVRPWEEADLEQRFGDPYREYRAAVRCWLPRFPGYRSDGARGRG